MFVFAISGVLLSAIWSNTLVAADPKLIVSVTSLNLTNYPNDYFEPWSAEIINDDKSYYCNAKVPVKKEIPENMQIKYIIKMEDFISLSMDSTFCESLTEDALIKTLADAGVPKDTFPRKCPFKAGDWAISNWRPPLDLIPPGIPDAQFVSHITLSIDGKEPCVEVEMVGQIKHG